MLVKEQWRLDRWGKFTGSEIYKLMVPGSGGQMFGKGALSYIKQVAREAHTLYNEEESVETYAMKMGKYKEASSFAFLERVLGFNGLTYSGDNNPTFKLYNADSGCSPDCVAFKSDGTVSFGAELKNPQGDTHFDYLVGDEKIVTQFDLKEKKPDYYGQVQFSMMCYETDLWLWCSCNEYYPPEDRMLIVEVRPDEKYQTNLKIRLKTAIEKKYEWLEKFKQRHEPLETLV